jgi:ribonuclease G
MNKELYVSSTPHETKVGLLEDDQLAEVFYERENEYTLAGSIYKGRVTRVLPGMQSAFVDIGLERDAFLYVSDFLELTDEEESEEFGEIPAPPVAARVSSQAQPQAESNAVETNVEERTEADTTAQDFAAGSNRDSENGGEGSEGEAQRVAEGARRWRGRRRRGGRRGGREDRLQRTDSPAESSDVTEPENGRFVFENRPTPQRYAPIVLPGESISKYRNLTTSTPETEVQTAETSEPKSAPVEDFLVVHPSVTPVEEEQYEVGEDVISPLATEVAAEESANEAPSEEHHGERHAIVDVTPVDPPQIEVPAPQAEAAILDELQPGSSATLQPVETTGHGTIDVSVDRESRSEHGEEGFAVAEPAAVVRQHEAPSEVPEGRMLEHETLEDDETEFHPMPENLEAMREVAGDVELELEEETLESDSEYSDRWIPKVADVDEDEVVAAEERGETRLVAREEDYEEEEDGEEEGNGRAELRAAAPTAAYQQRQPRRGGDYDRRGGRGFRSRRNNVRVHAHRPQPLISDLLKEGQEILIQIAKEPIAKKGARITSHIALPGRFLVYMPTVNHVGVSRKINSEEERQRLKRIVTSERENGIGGFIVRTAAANIKEEELRADIRFLKHLWAEIKNRADNSKSPALIYHDLNLVERVLRDQVNADFSQIWVDTEEEYERVIRFAQRFQPSLVRRIKLYTKTAPLFENFGIQDEINNALKSKVWLKSGGYIVINQTEALVAIDINTGKYVGKTQRLEDTIVKTNIEAIKEIVRQVRLRDLGGIIVIDFIDMDERKNRQKVMQALEEALRNDRAPSKALQFNDFGLVAITRKRVKQSLERTLGEACPYCTGAGFVKSVPTICNEIYIEMRKMIKAHDRTDVTLRVNPEIAKGLKANNGKLISEMEEMIGKAVLVKSDSMLHQENFDIQ